MDTIASFDWTGSLTLDGGVTDWVIGTTDVDVAEGDWLAFVFQVVGQKSSVDLSPLGEVNLSLGDGLAIDGGVLPNELLPRVMSNYSRTISGQTGYPLGTLSMANAERAPAAIPAGTSFYIWGNTGIVVTEVKLLCARLPGTIKPTYEAGGSAIPPPNPGDPLSQAMDSAAEGGGFGPGAGAFGDSSGVTQAAGVRFYTKTTYGFGGYRIAAVNLEDTGSPLTESSGMTEIGSGQGMSLWVNETAESDLPNDSNDYSCGGWSGGTGAGDQATMSLVLFKPPGAPFIHIRF